jgi:hypothetical protein
MLGIWVINLSSLAACDNSKREKSVRCCKRGTRETWARQGDLASVTRARTFAHTALEKGPLLFLVLLVLVET